MIEPIKFNRLPKYAQQEIYTLRRQLSERAETIRELRELRDNPDEATNVFIDHFRKDNTLLPKDSQISFTLGEDSRIDVRHDGKFLLIYGYSLRSEALAVYPRSTNTFHIGVVADA